MKRLIAAVSVLMTFSSSAQTLFTYGKESVSAKEFLQAYQRNNAGKKDEKSFREYLDLYIASRLKIKEAKAKKFDTLPHIISDLAGLRQQILPAYLNDKIAVSRLAEEAFARSQKDIRLAHIFISFKQKTPADVAAAKKKLADVQAELKNGTAFARVAEQFSDDPSAKQNGGQIGWVTVFSLPYELENLAYATPVRKFSAVHESKAGYHILYNAEERKSIGRIKAAQILLAFPPGAGETVKAELKQRADSLYNRIQKGDDFGRLASAFSNDVISAASNGMMPEFGVGEYDPLFEETVFALKQNEISGPFATSHGYHIVKLLQKIPPPLKKTDSAMSVLLEKVEQSDRIEVAKSEATKKILASVNVKEPFTRWDELWALSDSVIAGKPPVKSASITPATTLLQAEKRKYTVNDWYAYAVANRLYANGTAKPWQQLWNEFKAAKVNEYYTEHLEDYNEEFRNQLKEFAEGNLFFEIMQRQVWQPAQKDSVALIKYFEKNSENYKWKESADAVIFYAPNEAAANHFKSHLGSIADWRKAAEEHPDTVVDSGRYELSQIPGAQIENFNSGTITPLMVNPADNSSAFAYIIKTYPAGERRTFSQAKSLVINDYQEELERKWVTALKKKYPVVVNQKVWNEVVKSLQK